MLSRRLICLALTVTTFFISNQAFGMAPELAKAGASSAAVKMAAEIQQKSHGNMPVLVSGALVCASLGYGGYRLICHNQGHDVPTALHRSAAEGDLEQLERLLKSGDLARINELSKEPDYIGQSPLHIAVKNGHLSIVEALVAYNADINLYNDVQTCDYRQTPLTLAIEKGNLPIVQFLLKHGAKAEQQDFTHSRVGISYAYYPLHLAARKGNLPIIKALLEKKASIMRLDYKKKFPLHYAVLYKNIELIKALTEIPD
jgi:ankyrin repeat protein